MELTPQEFTDLFKTLYTEVDETVRLAFEAGKREGYATGLEDPRSESVLISGFQKELINRAERIAELEKENDDFRQIEGLRNQGFKGTTESLPTPSHARIKELEARIQELQKKHSPTLVPFPVPESKEYSIADAELGALVRKMPHMSILRREASDMSWSFKTDSDFQNLYQQTPEEALKAAGVE